MARQGYNEKQVIGVLDEELKCKICLAVLRDPVQISGCEHLFCRTCLTDVLRLSPGPRTCPTCRAELPASGGIVDAPRAIKRMLNKIKFKCFFGHVDRNAFPGQNPCQWKGELGDFDHHVERECAFGFLPCPKGCQASIARYTIADHYRVQCSEEEVACKFPGCDSKVKRCKVAEHNTENTTAHLDKMLVEHMELKRRNTGLETSLAAVKQDQSHACRRNRYLETALATVKPDLSFATLTAIANPGKYKFLQCDNVTFTNNHTTVEFRDRPDDGTRSFPTGRGGYPPPSPSPRPTGPTGPPDFDDFPDDFPFGDGFIGYFFGVDIDGVLEPGKCLDLTCVGVQGRSGNVTFKASTEGKSHDLQFSGVEVGQILRQILRLVLSQDGVLSAMAVGKASHPAPATAWPMGTATKVKIQFSVCSVSTCVYSLN